MKKSGAATFVNVPVFVVGVIAIARAIIVEKVGIITFDVWIDDNGQMASHVR